MKSIEKPFEYLSEKEGQIVQLCKEIILWGTNPENIKKSHSLDLKNKATDLYGRLSNIDMDNDDKYYKFYKEYDELKAYFEKIKGEEIEYEYEIIEGDFQELLDKIKNGFESGKNINLSKDWWTDQEAYGDYLNVSIEHFDNRIRLIISEMHDNFIYENDLVEEIANILKSFNLEYKYKKHNHSLSLIEHDFECEVTNFESLEELLLSIFEITEKTERKFKK